MNSHDPESELLFKNSNQTDKTEYNYKGIHAETTIYVFLSLFI